MGAEGDLDAYKVQTRPKPPQDPLKQGLGAGWTFGLIRTGEVFRSPLSGLAVEIYKIYTKKKYIYIYIYIYIRL